MEICLDAESDYCHDFNPITQLRLIAPTLSLFNASFIVDVSISKLHCG